MEVELFQVSQQSRCGRGLLAAALMKKGLLGTLGTAGSWEYSSHSESSAVQPRLGPQGTERWILQGPCLGKLGSTVQRKWNVKCVLKDE